MNEKLVALGTPLEISNFVGHKRTISLVKIRRPVVKDIIGLDFSMPKANESMVTLASRLTGLDERILMGMSLPDYNTIALEIGAMMNPATAYKNTGEQ